MLPTHLNIFNIVKKIIYNEIMSVFHLYSEYLYLVRINIFEILFNNKKILCILVGQLN